MSMILTDFIYKNNTSSSLSSALHLHKGYQIIFVTSGSVEMQIEEKYYKIMSPSVVLLNAFEKHLLANASIDYCRYVIDLEPLQTEKIIDYNIINMLKLRPSDFNHVIHLDEKSTKMFKSIFDNIQYELVSAEQLCDLVIIAEITKLLVYIFRKFPVVNETYFNQLALNIRQFIDTHYSENITVDSLSKMFFASTSYLSHLFKTYSGYGINEYLINTRLYNAQFMLLHTKDSIKRISLNCGYSDVNNFIRKFKAQYKLSPLQYRIHNSK